MSILLVKRVVVTTQEFSGLGEKIKAARKSDPRSLIEICETSKISRPYWYQVEKEELLAPVSEEIIRKIEDVLGVDLGVSFD